MMTICALCLINSNSLSPVSINFFLNVFGVSLDLA